MVKTREAPAVPPRRGAAVGGKRLVIGLLVAGVLAFAAIIWFIWQGQQRNRLMDVPPVGAGAGRTGMHNEHLGKRRVIEPEGDTPAPTH
jgi:hypothetical protein